MARATRDPARLPLVGVRIIDLSRDYAGPTAVQILADLGADVIKVENPNGGDEMRHFHPRYKGHALHYMMANRNKRGITLDLTRPAEQEALMGLIAGSDVVVENFRDETAAKLGVDYESLRACREDLIVCSVRGFATAANAGRVAYDPALQAYSGLMSLTGTSDGEVVRVGVAIVDSVTAHYGAIAILAALMARHATGEGEHIRLSLEECALSLAAFQVTANRLTGFDFTRHGSGNATMVPSRVFHTETRDLLAVANDRQFAAMCAVLDHPEWAGDERFSTNPARIEHRDELDALLQGEFERRPAEHWVEQLEAAKVPCAIVRTIPDIVASPETDAFLTQHIEHPEVGDLPLLASPIIFGNEQLPLRLAPPLLGEHDAELLPVDVLAARPASK